jgi:muramoyltetrapeptide carboxypeptidase
MPLEKMETCINTLEDWGYEVRLGSTTHSASTNYFSGTDEERLNDLQDMMDDRKVHAILCARGGYGMSRIIDRLNFKKFRKHPKWIVGFSDVTVLHAHLHSRFRIASLHAPMAAAFNDEMPGNPYILSLKDALEGQPNEYACEPHDFNQPGHARGQLVGGNLCLLAHLIGSRSDFGTKHKILFLEDVGEYLYNIDRLMVQMKRAGKFDKIEGLIIGGFTDSKDTERPFGKTAYEIIREHVRELDIPICYNFPVSHDRENYALKIGMTYTLDVGENEVNLKEKSQ